MRADEVEKSPDRLVSVIIVNFNGANVIMGCLQSVFAQPYRPLEVIVVDNGSTDGSAGMVTREFPDVHLIVSERNLGFAGGNNLGVARARGEFVVLLNNDTVVGERWLTALLEMLNRPNVAAVTSRVVTENVPAEFYEKNGTINYLGYNIMREFADLSQVFFAGGASLMFRKKDVGSPFPDEYFLYHEDVYLSWRLRLMGKSVAMAQQSVVHHKGSAATKRQPTQLVMYYQERNRLLNALVLYEGWTLIRLIPYFIADAVAKILLSLITGRKSVVGILQGYWWVLSHPGWIGRMRRELQNLRVVPDREVMRMLSCKVIDGKSVPAGLLNGLSRFYAQVVGLAFHE